MSRNSHAAAPGHWHRRVAGLAAPIILANLTQPLLSIVDTAIAGHLPGADALGGVALGGLFFNFVFWGFGFLRMGTTGLVAQALGAGDAGGLRATLLRALLLALAIGILLLALQAPLIGAAFRLLGGSASVQASAAAYAGARIWSAPAALANYVVLGYLLGRQRARLALVVQVLINLANAVLALVFVYRLGWGVSGLGAATAAADAIGLGAGLMLLRRLGPAGLPPVSWTAVFEAAPLRRLFAVNRDIFLRTLCLIGSFAWFAHEGAAEGDAVLAANALLLNFQGFMAFALDGFAQAAETLVGEAVGRRDKFALAAAIRASLAWSGAGAAGFSLAYFLAGGAIVRALTDQRNIREIALVYLPWAAISPLVSVWCFLFDGVYIGATRTRELRDGMALALIGFLGAESVLRPVFGNHGLWAALLLFMAFRGAVLGLWLGRIGGGLAAPLPACE